MEKRIKIALIVALSFIVVGFLSSGCGSNVSTNVTITFSPLDATTSQAINVTVSVTFSGTITEPSDWSTVLTLIASGSTTNLCTATSGDDTGYSWDETGGIVTCLHDDLSSNTEYTVSLSDLTNVVDSTTTFTTATAGYMVFVTSTTSTGDLGGLTGADTICNARAVAGGLSGTYAAWLSTDAPTNAKDRIVDAKYVKNYCRQTIADNLTELLSGTLQTAIDRDESGNQISAAENVWTGTASNGTVWETDTCDSYTWGAAGQDSIVGSSNATTGSWTDTTGSFPDCDETLRLYCFQISE